MKKTRFLFDVPLTKDWLFYVFLFFLASNIVSGLSNVASSGGPSTTSGGILSGLIDAIFRVVLSWFPVIPIISLIRKLVRKSKTNSNNKLEEI
jgi:hypothetical protein